MKPNPRFFVILVLVYSEKLVRADQQFEGSSTPCYDASKKAQVRIQRLVVRRRELSRKTRPVRTHAFHALLRVQRNRLYEDMRNRSDEMRILSRVFLIRMRDTLGYGFGKTDKVLLVFECYTCLPFVRYCLLVVCTASRSSAE